jgi:hypothetical protein
MTHRLPGLGRLTRVATCGLLAAAVLPASALADGLIGGVSAPVPVSTTSVTAAVSTPSAPVALPSVSTSTQVATPAASASVSASTSKPTVHATVATGSSRPVATSHRASKPTARKPHRRAHRAKPHRAATSRQLMATSYFEMYVPFPPMETGCNGETIATRGQEHVVYQASSDGTTATVHHNSVGVTGTSPNPANPLETINYTVSQEDKEYDNMTTGVISIDEYRKVIRQGDMGTLFPDDMFVHYVITIDPLNITNPVDIQPTIVCR